MDTSILAPDLEVVLDDDSWGWPDQKKMDGPKISHKQIRAPHKFLDEDVLSR